MSVLLYGAANLGIKQARGMNGRAAGSGQNGDAGEAFNIEPVSLGQQVPENAGERR